MNKHKIEKGQLPRGLSQLLAALLGASLLLSAPLQAAEPKAKVAAAVKKPARPVPASTEIVPSIELALGQSHLVRLPEGAALQRVKVDDEKVVQVDVTSPREVLLHAKAVGTTVIFILDKAGQTAVMDVRVVGITTAMDAASLQAKLQQLMPNEKGIKVSTAADSLVLSGTVADAVKVDKAMSLAEAYGGKDKDKKVINMLQVAAPQQVMLEVKIAEINRTEAEKLGFNFARQSGFNFLYGIMGGNVGIISKLGSPAPGAAGSAVTTATGSVTTTTSGISTPNVAPIFADNRVGISGFDHKSFLIDAQKNDGLVKILAEPNIVAISGQEGSFLAGGEILIPVAQANGTMDLQSKLFGVGLRFSPTVLDEGRINMKIQPEVTDLVGFSSVATTGLGAATLVPTLTTRRISTTVELRDGQSFAIGGLLQDNTRESIKRFPILGEIPILGALFRSTEFQKNKTELLIVVTPRLVKPLPPNYMLPTDSFVEPSRSEILLGGQLEGKPVAPATPAVPPENAPKPESSAPNSSAIVPKDGSTQDGFEMK